MQINNISPPPIDNDPPPSDEKQKVARQQFISVPVWGSFKTWLATELRAAVNQILQVLQNFVNANGTVTINENVTINGSLNGLSPVPGMAQMRDGGKVEIIAGQKIRILPYSVVCNIVTGNFAVSSASGQYYQVGNLVFLFVTINIGAFVSAGVVSFTTPTIIGTPQLILNGREDAISGYALTCVASAGSTMNVFKYDGTASVTASGDILHISGCYYTPQ